MRYDPNRHHRQSTRWRGFDYASGGAFFVTICAYRHACIFGEVVEGEMHLSECGFIVQEEWLALEHRREEVDLDACIVMPNHMHGILRLCGFENDLPRQRSFSAPIASSLGSVLGGFKSGVTRRLRQLAQPPECSWQCGFHDRVLRDEAELQRARAYIIANPQRWARDKYHPQNTLPEAL